MKSAAQRFAVIGCSAVVIAACRWPPDLALPALAPLIATAERAWAFSASIVLEASPYILVGAMCAAIVQRMRLSPIPSALFAMVAPACDCSMNGFAAVLARAPAALAGFAIVWSVACNPIALYATHAMLGDRVLFARIAGTLVAGALTALGWSTLPSASCGGRACSALDVKSTTPQSTAPTHFAAGLIALSPAALISGTFIAVDPGLLRDHATPMSAALLGALMSPCSTADAVLSRALMTTAPAQAVFVLAAQLSDARQLLLVLHRFGWTRTLVAAGAAAFGCWIAALVANR